MLYVLLLIPLSIKLQKLYAHRQQVMAAAQAVEEKIAQVIADIEQTRKLQVSLTWPVDTRLSLNWPAEEELIQFVDASNLVAIEGATVLPQAGDGQTTMDTLVTYSWPADPSPTFEWSNDRNSLDDLEELYTEYSYEDDDDDGHAVKSTSNRGSTRDARLTKVCIALTLNPLGVCELGEWRLWDRTRSAARRRSALAEDETESKRSRSTEDLEDTEDTKEARSERVRGVSPTADSEPDIWSDLPDFSASKPRHAAPLPSNIEFEREWARVPSLPDGASFNVTEPGMRPNPSRHADPSSLPSLAGSGPHAQGHPAAHTNAGNRPHTTPQKMGGPPARPAVSTAQGTKHSQGPNHDQGLKPERSGVQHIAPKASAQPMRVSAPEKKVR